MKNFLDICTKALYTESTHYDRFYMQLMQYLGTAGVSPRSSTEGVGAYLEPGRGTKLVS